MTTTVDSLAVYEWKVRGTATYFVRESVVNIQDVAIFDAAETAGASAAGTQLVDFDGSISAGADLVGKADGTYTCSITIDNIAYPVSVDLTAATTDFTALVVAINADLPNTECAISSNNLLFTSTTTGKSSFISVTDVDLFTGMNGFLTIADAVDGGTGGNLVGTTLTNGADAHTAYATSMEIFDTTNDKVVIRDNFAAADLNAVFSDTEVEAEVASLGVKVNALQNLVK